MSRVERACPTTRSISPASTARHEPYASAGALAGYKHQRRELDPEQALDLVERTRPALAGSCVRGRQQKKIATEIELSGHRARRAPRPHAHGRTSTLNISALPAAGRRKGEGPDRRGCRAGSGYDEQNVTCEQITVHQDSAHARRSQPNRTPQPERWSRAPGRRSSRAQRSAQERHAEQDHNKQVLRRRHDEESQSVECLTSWSCGPARAPVMIAAAPTGHRGRSRCRTASSCSSRNWEGCGPGQDLLEGSAPTRCLSWRARAMRAAELCRWP